MKCKYCGTKLAKGATICKKCGRENKSTFNLRKINKKTISIIAASVLAVIVVICVLTGLFSGPTIDAKVIDEESGEYMLVNVPTNYSFEINLKENSHIGETKDFVVYDIHDKTVKTKNTKNDDIIQIGAPEGGYEKGGIYSLNISGLGKFTDEEFKDATKITFIIEQKDTAEIIYQNGVKEPDGDVELKTDTIILNGKYKEGDIIVADTDNNQVDEIYKLVNAKYNNNKTTAQYKDPSADEIYKDISVFSYDYVDFNDAQIDENAFVGMLEETGIMDAFTEEAYAVGDSNIKVSAQKKGKASYEFIVVLKDPSDNNRKLKISFGVADKMLRKCDNELLVIDNTLEVTSGLEFSVEGKGKKATSKKIEEAIANYQGNQSTKNSESEYEVPLVPITIPIVGPISAHVDIGITADILFAAEFNAGIDTNVEFNQGIIYNIKKLKVQKQYSDITGDIEAYLLVKGNLDAFAGVYADVGLDILRKIDVTVSAKGGPYLNSQGCFSIRGIPTKIKFKGYYEIDLGLMCEADASVEIPIIGEKSFPIAEKKKSLMYFSNYLSLVDSGLGEEYSKKNEKVDLGDPVATYHNIINDKEVTAEIEKYSLYVDGKEVEVLDDVAQENISEGEHTFKIKWKYKGKNFEDEKKVTVSQNDPWAYYLKNKSVDEVITTLEKRYGRLTAMSEEEYYESWENFSIMSYVSSYPNFYKASDGRSFYILPTETEAAGCLSESGTASQLFGITSDISIESLEKSMGLNDDNGFSLLWTTDILTNAWETTVYVGDKEYRIALYSDVIDDRTSDMTAVGYDRLNIPRVTPGNFHKYFKGYKGDPQKLSPSTKVVVNDLAWEQ